MRNMFLFYFINILFELYFLLFGVLWLYGVELFIIRMLFGFLDLFFIVFK